MGRLSNTVGLRLGHSLGWKSENINYDARDAEVVEYVKDICIYGVGENQLQRPVSDVWFLTDKVEIRHSSNNVSIHINLYDTSTRSDLSEFVNESKLLVLEKYIVEELGRVYKKPVFVVFDFIQGEAVTAGLLSRYISIRLEQRVNLGEVVSSLRRLILSLPGVLGYRLDFSGRFTRRQRATFRSIKVGQVPFSTLSASLDYSESFAVLKYGKCGIKVCLNREK